MLHLKFEEIKENLYLIIPIICIILWALYALIHFLFFDQLLTHWDFTERMKVVHTLLTDPANMYHTDVIYFALPSQILLFVPFVLVPILVANYIFYSINIFLAIIFVRQFNKILILMDLNEKKYRFIFLMIISNGFIVYRQFWLNNVKFIVGVILFFLISREIQYRKEKLTKDLKYYWITYGPFALAIGIYPPLIYLLFIFLFQDIRYQDLLKIKSLKIYGIIGIWFAIQNFIIFVYPSLILDMFTLYSRYNERWTPILFFYLKEFNLFEKPLKIFLIVLTSIIMGIISFLLILNKKLQIEEKFAYFSLFSIFINAYAYQILLIIIPFILLIFVQFLNKQEKVIEFIKKNKILSIGLFGIIGVNFLLEFNYIYYKYLHFLENYPCNIIVSLRWVLFIFMIGFSVLILHIKKYRKKNYKFFNN